MHLYLLISLTFYFLAIYYFKKTNNLKLFMVGILGLAIASGFFSLMILTFFHFESLEFLGEFLVRIFPREGTWRFIGDLARKRLQTFWLVEYSIPILLYFIFFSKKFFKLAILGLIMSVIGIMLANNRFQLVALLFGFGGFFWFNREAILRHQKMVRYLIGGFILVMIFSLLLSNYFLGRNLIQRFLLTDYQRDVETITGRFYLFDQAWKMFLSSPFLGIGLRNFSFYLSPETVIYTDPLWKIHEITVYPHYEPHNIFFQVLAETGIFGLLAYLVLIFTFFKQDWFVYKKTKGKKIRVLFLAITFSSWTYFIDEQFTYINDALMAQVFFWFSRGLLAGLYLRLQSKKKKMVKKKKMILFVVNQWVSFGGVEKEINHLSSGLKNNFRSVVFSLGRERRWHPKIIFLLGLKMLKEKPTVVISFCEYANVITGLATLFYLFPLKLIFVEHNNPSAMFKPQRFKWLKKKIIWFFYNQVTFKVIAISQAVKNDLVKNFGVNKEQVEVVKPSFRIKEIKKLALKKVSLPKKVEKKGYFVAVGRLSQEKRFAYLVDVFEKVVKKDKNLKLLIIGEGKEEEELKKQIELLNLNNHVYLLGAKANPFPYIRNAIALALTSAAEGLPRVLLEAKVCGTPIIATNFIGVEEIVKKGQDGFIVGVRDRQGLEKAILQLSKNDRLRKKMSIAAKKEVNQYDTSKIVQVYRGLIE